MDFTQRIWIQGLLENFEKCICLCAYYTDNKEAGHFWNFSAKHPSSIHFMQYKPDLTIIRHDMKYFHWRFFTRT